MNDIEKNYLYEMDINDSLGYSDVKTKIAILGYFCFEKILISKVLLNNHYQN